MKIQEVTQSRVTRVQGDEVEIDNGDGTKTVVNRKENPDALERDPSNPNQVRMNRKNNSSGNTNTNRRNDIRVGQRVNSQQ